MIARKYIQKKESSAETMSLLLFLKNLYRYGFYMLSDHSMNFLCGSFREIFKMFEFLAKRLHSVKQCQPVTEFQFEVLNAEIICALFPQNTEKL